ncbi:hypothetical protein ACKVWC_010117 [Pyricularia oryzae]
MRRRTSPSPSAYRVHQSQHGQVANAGHGPGGQPVSTSSLLRSFNVETNPTRPMRPSPLTASTIRDMPLDLVDRIRSFPLFMSAPDEFLAAIGKHLRPQVHAPHDHILTEGDEARAMYWLVRGVVAVTSRDGEAVYAELKPGAFFGEIGVLMDMPRTATIIARSKCLLVVLKKEDLQTELPRFPDMEQAIRQEAQERLNILKKKQQERAGSHLKSIDKSKSREAAPGEVATGETGSITERFVVNRKKRKSPSPGIIEDPAVGGSALGSGYVNVRKTLTELPLFSALPSDILHFLGLSAIPKSFPPFTDIIQQGSQGNEIYFVVRGEAEVIHEDAPGPTTRRATRASYVRPRLHQGQYFGEVASLGLSPGRTATVRSITTVECLVISGQALEELWRRCPPELKLQVEETARMRYQKKKEEEDVEMEDAGNGEAEPQGRPRTPTKQLLPQVTFTTPSKPTSPSKHETETRQPTDPDPYLSVDMENMRNRRRNSLAPPTPQTEPSSPASSNGVKNHMVVESSPLKPFSFPTPPLPDDEEHVPFKKARTISRELSGASENRSDGSLPDDILISIFEHLDLLELLRLRAVSRHWKEVLTTSPRLCTHVNLAQYSRRINDWSIINVLAPFIGPRPLSIDISNCFHLSDEGFQTLWKSCGRNVKKWRMKSVWEVSAGQILEMSDNAKGLEEIDWSNCRKVGDNLLARVVGWVVPHPPSPTTNTTIGPGGKAVVSRSRSAKQAQHQNQPPPSMPPPGTVIGCPKLRKLDLSYCKHITDRSMAHLAAHASNRLESLSLTRCTSITDHGFQAWADHRLNALSRLSLADCTYLSDNAIVALVTAAKNLTHLDLSFCCALSDTATEVVALGLPQLRELRLAFCGSAVSDASLGCIALHLNELEGISVRGCVRVTGMGVENVLEGCGRLRWLDVSQCKNLAGWLNGGGVERWGFDDRGSRALRYTQSPEEMTFPHLQQGAVVRNSSYQNIPGYMGPGQPPSQRSARGSFSAPESVGPSVAGGSPRAATWHPGRRPGMYAPPGAGFGPVLRPVMLPKGVAKGRTKQPVRFIVEKGHVGLR